MVSPDTGLIVRGHPLLEIKELWPEEIFFLLLTGQVPDAEAKTALQTEFDRRSQVPEYVWDLLHSMPEDSHPMCMLDTAILCMEKESTFREYYDKGMGKADYWIPMYDDALTILARLPGIAAIDPRLYPADDRQIERPARRRKIDLDLRGRHFQRHTIV